MSYYLGIDTSNYTTSCAVYHDENNSIIQRKKLLPVKEGELGLRQSDAVFHHTVQLPELIKDLFSGFDGNISAVGVSDAPMRAKGSYMPCFLAGVSVAESVASVMNIPLYKFSHQQGHIMAALYSSGRTDLYDKRFLAFHVSGGTTQALLVEKGIDAEMFASSLDLKAGQAVDRVGVMLGYPFPAGKYEDELASKSDKKYKINIKLKDGNCCLSGVENKCRKMLDDGETEEDICRYCIDYIMTALYKMTLCAKEKYGNLDLVFSGGVMSNSIIKKEFTEKLNANFAEPVFSSDNAAGTAILTSYMNR
ncbi:MAG: peptidase M22 [Ruminococcus sp.]|nr:peptidase M22 [Candidatus Copronaster equi]